jgi:rhodanese-related sulfurtransferase
MTRPEYGGRSHSPGAGYAGDLSPREAWDVLSTEKSAVLVDCRSQAEWSFVGLPDLSKLAKKPVLVEWQSFSPGTPETGFKPRMTANLTFAQDLERAGVPKEASIIFICRSGGRSRSAAIAMTQQGWKCCYNLAGGFEGAHGPDQHRGTTQGWKADGLPWWQE